MNLAKPRNQQQNHNDDLQGRGRALHEAEAAEALGVKVRTLPAWRARGTGPRYFKVGAKAVRYFEADLIAFLDAGAVDPTTDRS
ncbi:MAG: helix-turn-helix domain-containing protein [Acidobacteria bacterium]|nr:MAG: helix-turn-helix domain-containing protein [Acidobacteriota bacterium]